jgi:hypothetical protein
MSDYGALEGSNRLAQAIKMASIRHARATIIAALLANNAYSLKEAFDIFNEVMDGNE